MRIVIALLALLLTGLPLQAAERPYCNTSDFRSGAAFGLARGKGPGRIYFHKTDHRPPQCPQSGDACRSGYILPGQLVLTQRTQGELVCAIFPNGRGGTAGWMRKDALTMEKASIPRLSAWTGRWKQYDDPDNYFDLSVGNGALKVSAQAVNGFAHSPHIAEIVAEAKPKGDYVIFDDGCHVEARLIGPYLAVTDNDSCHPGRVNFKGIYRRAPAGR
jgi:hypothetical protein